MRFPLRALGVGSLFLIIFSYVAVVADNRYHGVYLPAAQISCISMVFVLLLVVLINPLTRLMRLRPFDNREIFLIFIMSTVPAGIPVYGFVCQALPHAASLYHPEWNTPQSEWDKNVVPILDENFFVKDPAAVQDYVSGLGSGDPYPVFVKKSDETLGEFGHRMWRYCTLTPQLDANEVRHWWAFYRVLDLLQKKAPGTPGHRLWSRLPAPAREAIAEVAQKVRVASERETDPNASLGKAIEALLKRPDFYDANAFAGISLPSAAQALLDRGRQDLSPRELRTLNQAALESAIDKAILTDWRRLSQHLTANQGADAPGPERRIWSLLSDRVKETVRLTAAATQAIEDHKGEVIAACNQAIAAPDLYDATAFKGLELPERARTLLAQGSSLSDHDRQALNRLLVEAVLPRSLQTYDVSLFGDIKWHAWVTPFISWGLFALVCYFMFYALNEIIFKQWYENEKLIFPIAQLAESVLESDPQNGHFLPPILRKPSFWLGFAIPFCILMYNGMIRVHWLEGLSSINLRTIMDPRLKDTCLQGLGPQFRFEIFFTVIGLAFLLPVEVSFSAWFFFVIMMLQQLIAVWLGYGVDGRSFPRNWYYAANFMTAQGGGAMEVFGLICLWKVRHPFLAFVYRFARPQGLKSFSSEEIKQYTVPSACFFLATVGFLYFMRRGNMSWGMCIVGYMALLLMTVALVRLVAECGLISFQINFGPLHILRIFGLLKFPVLFAAKGMGTLMILMSGLFLDVKAFMAPTMSNAKYLAARKKIPNAYYALSIFVGILIALVVATITAMALVHEGGVPSMDWSFTHFPHGTFTQINHMVTDVESWQKLDPALAGWTLVGGVTCAILVFLRQTMFWIPHPIGLVMFVNPLMKFFWFSFLVGWLCKRTAVRYCTGPSYDNVRAGFIGMIMGEVVAIFLSVAIAILTFKNMGLTLDRSW